MTNLALLASFTAAAEAGTFTAAAARLDLTPAAVSKNVARLEAELGVRLFNRSTRQLRLTAEGDTFRQRAAAALRMLDEALAEVGRTRGAPVGRVRISVGVSFGRRYVLPLLPDLTTAHPQLQIELSLDNRTVDLLAEGFDIGIRGGVIPDSGLVARRIAKLPLVLVASPSYLRRHGAPNTPDDLTQHRLLGVRLSSGQEIPWRFRKPSGRGSVERPVNAPLWLSDPEALLDPALAHAGIAQLGLHHAMPFLRSGRLKAVLTQQHDPGQREIVMHYPHRQYLAPRVRVVVDALLGALAQDPDLTATRESLPASWLG
ncbi:MAG: LysR family transcriptional regulator [Inhella sp.]|jgi:DNA-binding transcriptional LysR family regulator|uniref:LysR family transcriptional regulator n=1 Tax=Inhella sp. TaxID=1921806 RepID=UPI0022C6B98D|nr:LysR family transcriptional regulator [Inhella sp.]MCZ8235364.1 LysR family transcriptional regulator [Inhella sp.]